MAPWEGLGLFYDLKGDDSFVCLCGGILGNNGGCLFIVETLKEISVGALLFREAHSKSKY
jgi:hypothetical protein